MNRRDFCISFGTVVAAGTFGFTGIGHGTIARKTSDTARPAIRAKKIFADQWAGEMAFDSPDRQADLLRKRLEDLAPQHDSLLVSCDERVGSRFLETLAVESKRIGLDPYRSSISSAYTFDVPAGTAVSVCPLVLAGSVVEPCLRTARSNDGCLISYKYVGKEGAVREHRRIVLSDSSRARWLVFDPCDCPEDLIAATGKTNEKEFRLAVARLLDRVERQDRTC